MDEKQLESLIESENLSLEEVQYLKSILMEVSATGTSKTLDAIWAQDYEEIPVSIDEFLTNDRYLGKSVKNDQGELTLYPYWQKVIKDVFAPGNQYMEVALSGCLAGNTRVPLLNGTTVTIQEMYVNPGKYEVYSFDDRINEYTVGNVTNIMFTGVKPTYKITFDNGEHVIATDDHKFLTRDKHWKSIKTGLEVGTSLMPFNRFIDEDGYEHIYHPQKNGSSWEEPTHRMSKRSQIGKYKGVTHHKDFNKRNNSPSNLLKTSWSAHKHYHAKLGGLHLVDFNRKAKIKGTKEYEYNKQKLDRARDIRWSDPQQRIDAAERMIQRNLDHEYQKKCQENKTYEGYAERMINYNKYDHPNLLKNTKEELINAISQCYNYYGACEILDISHTGFWSLCEKYDIDPKDYVKSTPFNLPNKYWSSRLTVLSKIYQENGYINDELTSNIKATPKPSSIIKNYFNGDEEAFIDLIANYNHKIVSIEYYDTIDVYDLTVDKYHNFALESGVVVHNCIGSGKTTEAVVCLCYILYRLLCLKNPANYYNLNRGSKIAIAFFNINMEQAMGVGYARMQTYLKQSPWFVEHGSVIGRNYPTYYPGKNIELLVGSKMEHFIGRDVFAALLDELNFAPGQDISMEKSNVLKLYNTIRRRIDSRFMRRGVIPGKLFLVSSKDDEYDFLEQYINRNKNNPKMYLVDEPLWVVKSGLGLYSGETFNVAVGDRYNKSRILSDNEDPEFISNQGQQVIKVPVEHREAFELDINTALADIAGVAIVSSSKYFVMSKVSSCYRSYMKNPFKTDEIMLGFDDETQLKDFLIESLLPKMNRNKPHHIHWDASKTGDRTGLSMITYANTKQVRRLVKGQVSTVTDNVYKVVFAIGIKNVPGEEIPFYKIRNFIYYIRDLGFNIASVSCDSYQSVDTIQQFRKQGFNSETLSVDRTREPYDTLKNAVNEGRLIMPKIPILEKEFEDVEEDRLRGKVDHTQNGSKDILDTLAANVYKMNRSYAPKITSNTANDFVMINASSGLDDDFDYDGWIIPEGITVI